MIIIATLSWSELNSSNLTKTNALLNTLEPYIDNSMSSFQASLNDFCCTTKLIEDPQPKGFKPGDIKTLSDIIKYFGNLPLRSFQIHESFDEIPTIEISCNRIPIRDNYSIKSTINTKENNKMANINPMNSASKMFNGLFGKIAPGLCRLSMNGRIAVKTSSGDYKTYNVSNNRLVNCSNFVFDVGDDLFFVVPTNKVEPGDIILFSGKPKCIIKSDSGTITVINYEDSTIETILPERHMFLGNMYYYGKIVSMFGDCASLKSGKSMKHMMKWLMMSEMMHGSMDGMSSMLPFMMFSENGFGDIFSGLFEPDNDDDEKDDKDLVNTEDDD